MKTLIPKFNLLLVFFVSVTELSYGQQYAYITIDDPNATGGTVAQGISDQNIVGYYTGSAGSDAQGFLYNGTTYTTLDDPNATENNIDGPNGTYAQGISGNNIVGYYFEGTGIDGDGSTAHGFLYNGRTYVAIDDPNANSSGTAVTGISGHNVVGYYFTDSGAAGFVYNTQTSTYTTIEDGTDTYLLGISGRKILGETGPYPPTSFTYRDGIFTTLTGPTPPPGYISANGISGNDIVGELYDGSEANGFLYNGATYTILDDPDAADGTYATGTSRGDIVGAYYDSNGNPNGFLAVPVPEPSSHVLILLEIVGLALTRRFVLKRM